MRLVSCVSLAIALVAAPLAAQETHAPPPQSPTSGTGGDIVSYDSIHKPTIGRGGMVVSQNAIASRVGAEILKKGGTRSTRRWRWVSPWP